MQEAKKTLRDITVIIERSINSQGLVYPTGASGIAVYSGLEPWVLGDFVEVVPANVIEAAFSICRISIEDADNTTIYEIALYAGIDEVTRKRVNTKKEKYSLELPVLTPVIPANSQIQARVMSEEGDDMVTISIEYFCY